MAVPPAAMKGAYYPSWAKNFGPSSINTNLYTHIYYAFLTPNNVTFEFHVDLNEAQTLVNFTSILHATEPPMVTLFSVGGAAEGTAFFSRMAGATWSRAAFIQSSIEVARRFGFDGIDLDWQFPQSQTDMENLGSLLEEWRAAVRTEAAATNWPELLLSAAVYYRQHFPWGAARAYPSSSITRNLDWINIMSYDYHGSWNKSATGAHAALFDPNPNSNLSTSFGLDTWIRAGVPRSKIIMGLPLYGKTWRLKHPRIHGIGAAAVDVGPGPDGVLTYAEIVSFNEENNANIVHDETTGSVYSVAGDYWVGYDDTTSVSVKVEYAKGLGLGGYFFWKVTDDYNWTISETASHEWSAY